MGNKMFVIGGNWNKTCEVFDSISRKFTAIRKIELIDSIRLSLVGINNKIYVFPKLISCTFKTFHIYDVLSDQWCVKEFDIFEVEYVSSCSKLPVI